MIKIKFEIEESEETPLPLPIENENVGSPSGNKVTKKLPIPEKNVVEVPKKKKKKKSKSKQLDNFTPDSVAVGLKSIKTEPAESSLSLTTQLNLSQNIQSLLIRNRIQNGWTTNEQSIPIGTQQQQQSLLSTKTKPIVPENHQEVPLSLNQSSSSISIGTLQQKQQSLLSTKTDPFVPEVTLSLIPNSNFGKIIIAPREQDSVSGLMSGPGPSSSPSAMVVLAAPSLPEPPLTLEEKKARQREYCRLWYHRQKANPEVMDEVRRRQREYNRLRYLRYPEEIRLRKLEYNRNYREQRLANATPEQREQRKLKRSEYVRRLMEKETEEQRERRLEQKRQHSRMVGNQRKKQQRSNWTPELREQRRLENLERVRRYRNNETDEQHERRLEGMRQYKLMVAKKREELEQRQTNDTGSEGN